MRSEFFVSFHGKCFTLLYSPFRMPTPPLLLCLFLLKRTEKKIFNLIVFEPSTDPEIYIELKTYNLFIPTSCDRLRLAATLADVNANDFGGSSCASLSVKPIFLNVETLACGTVFGYEYLIGLIRPPNDIAPNSSSNLMEANESLRGRDEAFILLLFLAKIEKKEEEKNKDKRQLIT